MKRKTRRRVGRWSDRLNSKEAVTPYPDSPPREPRRTAAQTGQGPYEVMYDISHGYGQDRLIVLP